MDGRILEHVLEARQIIGPVPRADRIERRGPERAGYLGDELPVKQV